MQGPIGVDKRKLNMKSSHPDLNNIYCKNKQISSILILRHRCALLITWTRAITGLQPAPASVIDASFVGKANSQAQISLISTSIIFCHLLVGLGLSLVQDSMLPSLTDQESLSLKLVGQGLPPFVLKEGTFRADVMLFSL